jgi:cyclophilin family peptidyl-prolyl cis-trans isomerase
MMRRALIPVLATLAGVASPALAHAGTNDVVRFSTSLGNIDVQLLPEGAPKTVANFLGYVQSGAYAGTFFHRSVPGFVIQGGGYSIDSSDQLQTIPPNSPVQNEFRVSNTRGTLAMAKLGSDPNSATDQWFFNLADNGSSPSNLDTMDGGFTVFGEVMDQASIGVMDKVAAQTVCDESLSWGQPFSALPVQTYTASDCSSHAPFSSHLIMSPITVLSLDTTAPVITVTEPTNGEQLLQGQSLASQFSCADPGGTGVQACSAPAQLDTSAVGPHVFSATSTDYAGNTSTQSVDYVVSASGSNPTPSPAPTPKPKASPMPSPAGSLTASRPGAVSIPLRCSAAVSCTGTAALYALGVRPAQGKTIKSERLGLVRYSIAAHKTGKLALQLSHRILTQLRNSKSWRIRVSLVFTPTHGTSHDKTGTLRLTR